MILLSVAQISFYHNYELPMISYRMKLG